MNKEELADAIVEVVESLHGSVTHGTLIDRLGDVCRGDAEIVLAKANIAIMVGASEVLCDALTLLKEQRRVNVRPIEFMCLLIDGAPIPTGMPLAKRPPANGYKETHFAPVCLDPCDTKEL